MLFVLDSSILCSNFHMTGPSFEILRRIGTIVIPEIVYDEVCNKYRELLVKHKESLFKVTNDISRLTQKDIKISFDESMIEEEYKKYVDILDMFIIESGMTIPEPYPQIKHKDIVARALQRKKPFKSDGSTGYRDYLLWCTCLNIARQYSSEEIHFITNNTKDFSDANKSDVLHPDLQYDLTKLDIGSTRFHYWCSLNNFIDQYAAAISKRIDDVEKMKESIQHNSQGFINPVYDYINSTCCGINLQDYDVFAPGHNLLLKRIDDIISLGIDEIISVDNDLLLEINVECIGIVESRVDDAEIKELKDLEEEFDFVIAQRIGTEAILHTTMGLKIQIRALYNSDKNEIKSIEITDIEDYYCPYCP